MAVRQNSVPVTFNQTVRSDNQQVLTSGLAGKVIPVACVPFLRGDSAAGRMSFNLQLAEMPKPLENQVMARVQAWVVPRPALPQFESTAEYQHSYQETDITKMGASARTPAALFGTVGTGAIAAAQSSAFFISLGICLQPSTEINVDYIDAYNLVQNFRIAAHSTKITRYDYYSEDAVTSLQLKPAIWPPNRVHSIVPDYEQALVVGGLDLDVLAGSLPISGAGLSNIGATPVSTPVKSTGGVDESITSWKIDNTTAAGNARLHVEEDPDNAGYPNLYAEMAGATIGTSLADIDKARTSNAFAKLRASYAGTNFSGYNNDDVIVSELMQGFRVDDELFNRPWLIDSKTVLFGMNERHATDAANLDDSVSTGSAGVELSINVPRMEYGGILIATVEVMPERLYPRQSDEYLYQTAPNDLPNALRDAQIVEPVDTVLNREIDTLHTTPNGIFGYQPLNGKWKREYTRLGGEFRALTPGATVTAARTAIWQPEYIDPVFTSDHWLCPSPFPQDVFSVPDDHCVNIAVDQRITISGLTQFGDELVEDNSDYIETTTEA